MNDMNAKWDKVFTALLDASGIAWDGCHKIYVLMDDLQMALMESYGYERLVWIARLDGGPTEAQEMLRDWWDESCGLRFISAVKTVKGDANKGFTDLIAQFEDEI
jgi:hypothetical protein